MGVEGVQRHAVAEVVERRGEGGRRPAGARAPCGPPARARPPSPRRRGGPARRGRGVAGGSRRRRPRRAPTRSAPPPRLDRGVDVDVVALWLPAGAVEPDAQPGQRPAQRRPSGSAIGARSRPGIALPDGAPVRAIGTPAHVPLGIGVGAGANAAPASAGSDPAGLEETVPLPWGRAPPRWVGACAPAGPATRPRAGRSRRCSSRPSSPRPPTGLVTSAPMSGSPPSSAISSSSGRSSAWAAGRRCGDSPFAATPRSAAASKPARPDRAEGRRWYAGAPRRCAPGERGTGVGVETRRRRGRSAERTPGDERLVRRQGPVALDGEVPAGEGRPADEAPHDVGVEASGRQQRRLHRDGDDLVGRGGGGVDEHRLPVGPPGVPGLGASTSSGRPPIADATSRRRSTSGPAAGRRGIGRQPSTLTKCLFLPLGSSPLGRTAPGGAVPVERGLRT